MGGGESRVGKRQTKTDNRLSNRGETAATMPQPSKLKPRSKSKSLIQLKTDQEHQLRQELLAHNDFFDMLVDMIPSKLYVAGQSGDDYNPKVERYYKKSTEESKQARQAAAKLAKRRKLDPATVESTRQVQQRVAGSKDTANPTPPKPLQPAPTPKEEKQKEPLQAGQSRIEALRAKLHAKIKALGQNRPAPEDVSKRAARRADKLKRRAEAAERAKEKQQKEKAERITTKQLEKAAAAKESLEHLEFGRLTGFTEGPNSKHYAATNKSLRNLSTGKNLEKMLADAKAKKEKMRSSAPSDQASMQWKDVLSEAKGNRVKDDTDKLKRKIKQKAASKAKSQKAWAARLQNKQSQQQSKQAIRNHNLQQRQKGGATGANLSKKRIAKEGGEEPTKKRRAGFEGRKREFMN